MNDSSKCQLRRKQIAHGEKELQNKFHKINNMSLACRKINCRGLIMSTRTRTHSLTMRYACQANRTRQQKADPLDPVWIRIPIRTAHTRSLAMHAKPALGQTHNSISIQIDRSRCETSRKVFFITYEKCACVFVDYP